MRWEGIGGAIPEVKLHQALARRTLWDAANRPNCQYLKLKATVDQSEAPMNTDDTDQNLGPNEWSVAT